MTQGKLFETSTNPYAPDTPNPPQGRPERLAAETRARDRGMAVAAAKRREWLSYARSVARLYAERAFERTCDVARVREELARLKYEYEPGNWMGSIFKDGRWSTTGQWRQVDHKGGHCRMVRVWRLK